MPERDMDKHPYSADEKRVVDYIIEVSKDQVGGGDDPIGFLIASHRWLISGMREAKKALDREARKKALGEAPSKR